MASNVLYVRNTQPHALLIREGSSTLGHHALKYTLERRGHRGDSIALPGEWRDYPVVIGFFQKGFLEEISKDAFMTLGTRPEDTIVDERGKPKRVPGVTETPLKDRAAADIYIPINPEDHRQPTVITEENLRKSATLRTPRPEFATEVPTTSEDLLKIEEARKLAEANPAQVDFPEDKTEQLQLQVQELTSLVQQLLADKAEVKEPAPKKRGRPRKTADPMSPEGKEVQTSESLME